MHFDTKCAHFVKLNNFVTNLSNDLHFTTFEVKTLLKTPVTAHQSFTFALFCQLIAQNFQKIGTKMDLQSIYDRGCVFSEPPCSSYHILPKPPLNLSKPNTFLRNAAEFQLKSD